MRVAIVSDWFAPRQGGIEVQLAELASRLVSRGHEVDVITSTPGARSANGYRVRPLMVMTLPGLHLALSPRLFSALEGLLQPEYDAVHAHVSVVSPVGYAAATVARQLGLATVVTFHSVLRGQRYLLGAANAVAGIGRSGVAWTAVSQLVAGQARNALGAGEVSVLPNGIDLDFWTAAPGRTTARQTVTLVSAMRLHRKKRPTQLLRAFAKAAPRSQPTRLLIVGDGPLRDGMEREIRDLGLNGGSARAEMLGWLHRDELRSLYADCDGFALGSSREAFGIATLEARAAGLAVIAMKAAGSTEFLRQEIDALLCDDDAELAQSIRRFLSDDALRARLSSSRSELARYDWEAVLTAHEVAYARAMKRSAAVEDAVAASV